MKKLTIAALVTVLVAGATVTAMADRHRGGPEAMFEQVDADADGAITKGEIEAHRAGKFANADTNGDSFVSLEEFEAFSLAERERKQSERMAKRFAKLDSNSDGVISAEEHAAADDQRLERMFSRIDTDGDGVITETERDAAKEAMKERRGKRGMGRRG